MNSSDVSPVNDASSKYGASLIHLAANAAFHAATLPAFLPIRQIISPSVRLAGRRSWQKTFLHSAGETNWRASIDGNRDKWRTAVKVKTISWKCLSMAARAEALDGSNSRYAEAGASRGKSRR